MLQRRRVPPRCPEKGKKKEAPVVVVSESEKEEQQPEDVPADVPPRMSITLKLSSFRRSYEKNIVLEFFCNLSKDVFDLESPDKFCAYVRGKYINFSSQFIDKVVELNRAKRLMGLSVCRLFEGVVDC